MVTIKEQKTIGPNGLTYFYFTGESTDVKPTGEYPENSGLHVADSSVFFENDTGLRYDCSGATWTRQGEDSTAVFDASPPAFSIKKNLKRISIPEGCTSVPYSGFSSHVGLESIKLPASVQSIPGNMCANCSQLKEVIVSPNITQIADYAFNNCVSLRNIDFSKCKKLTTISPSAFQGCTNFEGENGELKIPETVTNIGTSAFGSCKGIKKLVLPKSITTLAANAFSNCTGLEEVECLMSYLETTPSFDSENLKSIKYPTRAKKLGTLSGCKSLKAINFPEELTDMDAYQTFSGCESLEDIQIPSTVTKLTMDATFKNCKKLTHVELPDTITNYVYVSFGSTATETFAGCENLETVILGQTCQIATASMFEGCSKLKNVTLRGMVIIRANAFEGCTSLENIELPASVTQVLTKAFLDCTSLKSIEFSENLTTIGANAFQGCEALETITINKPEGSVTGAPWGAPETTQIIWTGEAEEEAET